MNCPQVSSEFQASAVRPATVGPITYSCAADMRIHGLLTLPSNLSGRTATMPGTLWQFEMKTGSRQGGSE
jgi:hypothetical protein